MTATLRYTDEQSRALSTDASAVALEAGAGCGKTFVLTERLLAHLDPTAAGDGGAIDEGPAVDEVVAITFTDAAAREMRDRVRRKCLERLADAEGEASAAWLRLLRSLDATRVSTIHAFCGALLRSHAVELGLDPSFAVLEQAAADVLLSEAIDTRLREGLDAQEEPVIALAAEFEINGFKQRLREVLAGPMETADGWLDQSAEELTAAWAATYAQQLAAPHRDAVQNDPNLDTLATLLAEVNKPTPKFAEKRAAVLDALHEVRADGAGQEAFAHLRGLLSFPGKLPERYWPEDDLARFRASVSALREKLDDLPGLADAASLRRAAELGLALLRVAAGVADHYAAAKQSAGALDYDDLLVFARRLLTAPEHAEAQRALRRQVRLLLVDEFQDTDRLQADLVRALVGMNTGDGDAEGVHDGGRLFFVGDFKQSIYRFRGAEPAVFRGLQDDTPVDGRLPLSTNFRSQPAVLDFVNHLFGGLFGERYTPLSAAREQATAAPACELLVTPPSGEAPSVKECRQAEARAIARRLRGLFDDGTPLVADEETGQARAARPGDVAILFQALSDVQHYEQALREQGIEYYLVGGHAFYSQQEVYDVLHLLRSVASGCDEVSLAGVLRSPMFALEDETLYWMRQASGSLNASIGSKRTPAELAPREAGKLARARSVLRELRSMPGRASTVELLTTAIDRTGYDAALLADFLGERKLANLEKLLEQARASDAAGGDLPRFLRQLGEFTLRQPKEALASTTSEGADVVRLMTVHHAKGLEFPVVVLPDLGRKSRGDKRQAVLDERLGPLVKPATNPAPGMHGLDLRKRLDRPEEQAETVRKFYVACTRAADCLMLSAVMSDGDAGGEANGEWLGLLAERYDLTTGAAADDGPAMRVTRGDASPAPPLSPKKRADRLRMIDAAREEIGKHAGEQSATRPLAIDPQSLRQFTVSRLTGKLHQGRERPEGVAVQQALRGKRSTVDPRGLGTLVHAVLEQLPLGDPNAARHAAALCHELAPLHVRRRFDEAAAEAAEMLERFVNSGEWAAFAAAERYDREVEFLLPWPHCAGAPAWLRGYLDALVLGADGAWRVIDFKTNHTEKAGAAGVAEQYRLQLGVYAMAVEQAVGEPPAGTRLCFLRPGEAVDFEWNDAARDATIQQVNEAIARVRADV